MQGWGSGVFLKRPVRPDKSENTGTSSVLAQLHVTVPLPPAVALLWSCLERRVGPSFRISTGRCSAPILTCPMFFSSLVVLWMGGWMCALLSSQASPHSGSSLPFLQGTGAAASRPEDITPHTSGVALTAGFKPVLHIKGWIGIYSSKLKTHRHWGAPTQKQSCLRVAWERDDSLQTLGHTTAHISPFSP